MHTDPEAVGGPPNPDDSGGGGHADATGSAQSGAPLVSGQRWHVYQIGDEVPCVDGWAYHAVNVGMLEDVHLHVRPVELAGPARAETWTRLQNGKYPGLVQIFDAIEEDGLRYEVSQVPPPATLREWANTHKASLDDVESLVRQLAATIQALHLVGIVHCNISMDTIHLVAADAGLKVVIGGLGRATLYDQAELIDLPVNPLYAPPEAAGLTRHRGGPGLRAWDWWSLGRVMQELVLGKPVLSFVLGRDVSRMTPELMARAEELLLERDTAGPRAGAVEKMPPMSDDLARLLRGLLASSRDGRWGWFEVQAWLKREVVPDRYELGRDDRLFLWNDRAFTLEEAAEYFTLEENWKEGVRQLMDDSNSAHFISFVSRESELSQLREKLSGLREFMQLRAWSNLPAEVARTLVAAISWQHIGSERRRFLLKGRRVDLMFLRQLIREPAEEGGVSLLRALIAPAFVQLVEARDPETARVLSTLSTSANEVESTALQSSWLKADDTEGLSQMLFYVLEGEGELMRRRDELKKRFAYVRDAQLDAILKAPKSKQKELVLLAFAATQPERAGFVTHDAWANERRTTLQNRGENLSTQLFWLRLERLQRSGPLVFGYQPWVALGWIVLALAVARLVAPIWMAPAALGVFLGMYLLRVLPFIAHRNDIRKYSKSGYATPWRCDAARCRAEAAAVLKYEPLRTNAQVERELRGINAEIAALKAAHSVQPVPKPRACWVAQLAVAVSWLVVLVILIWSIVSHGNAKAASSAEEQRIRERLSAETPADEKPATPFTSEQRFFTDPQVSKEPWPFEEPAEAPTLWVRGYSTPTPEQVANALIDGWKLLMPYTPNSASGVIAVPVATDTSEPGVVLYDTRRKMLLDRRIYKLDQLPEMERTWHQMDGRTILYLGEAPNLRLHHDASPPAATAKENTPNP